MAKQDPDVKYEEEIDPVTGLRRATTILPAAPPVEEAPQLKEPWYKFFTKPWPIIAAIVGVVLTFVLGLVITWLKK
jgi:hypothetical protein